MTSIRSALFLDLPYILDSVWRRAEFARSRVFDYGVDDGGVVTGPRRRPYWRRPPLWLYLGILAFVVFGSTFDALCSFLSPASVEIVKTFGVWACYSVAAVQFFALVVVAHRRAALRFAHESVTSFLRRATVQVILILGVVLSVAPWFLLADYLSGSRSSSSCIAGTAISGALTLTGMFAVALFIAWLWALRTMATWLRILGEALLLVSLAYVLWLIGQSSDAREAAQMPYFHVYAVVASALAVIAAFAPLLVRLPFHSITENELAAWQSALERVELFPGSRRDPDLTWRRVLGALAIGVLSHPLQVLFLPSAFVVLTPEKFLWPVTIASVAISLLLITIGNLSSRWRHMVIYVDRWFLIGTPVVVSLLVIFLAAMRMADVQYVTTVLEVAPFGVLFSWILMAYALLWWFEGHLNTVASTELLRVLGAIDGDRVRYAPGAGYVNSSQTTVTPQDRWLVAHSAGRLAIIGWFKERQTGKPTFAFFTYGLSELLEKLRAQEDPNAVHEMQRRLNLYFAAANLLVITVALLLGTQFSRGDRDNTVAAVVEASMIDSSRGVDLADLLSKESDNGAPALVVAASGGGTRAALYAATALTGLSDLGYAKDIVLLSGVSGGGVAAAYFYAHRNSLIGLESQAWKDFRRRMELPFVADVLEGAMEWRVFTDHPLSLLLAESFERRLFSTEDSKTTIGSRSDVGLLLNTTIAAHPLSYTQLLSGAFEPTEDCVTGSRPLRNLAGGRLIFGNLAPLDLSWDRSREDLPDVQLPHILVGDPNVGLASAAALTANFPPVFPNARVDLQVASEKSPRGCKDTFFVTDGGALENLGLVSALLAVRSAVLELASAGESVRDIHVIALEASAFSYDYEQDRGIGAATVGKERLTGELTLELLDDIERALDTINSSTRVQVHYLPLPTTFRSRGGFGTHWMAPAAVTLQNPRLAYLDSGWSRIQRCRSDGRDCEVRLTLPDLEKVWGRLFSQDDFCAAAVRDWSSSIEHADKYQVARWICGGEIDGTTAPAADFFIGAWRELKKQLPKR